MKIAQVRACGSHRSRRDEPRARPTARRAPTWSCWWRGFLLGDMRHAPARCIRGVENNLTCDEEGPVAGSHRPRAYVQAKPAGGQTGLRDDPAEW